MSINPQHLRTVIEPVLMHMEMHSEAAVNLLLGTAAQESHLGRWLVQHGGPALGIYQMEPNTIRDINRYLSRRTDIRAKVGHLELSRRPKTINCEIIGNLYLATALARIRYWYSPDPLPAANDVRGLANYWKKHYNTSRGKGSPEEFIANYNRLVLGGGSR